MTRWSILYRGPLSSCNYGCGYCPFAKRPNSKEELADDAVRLARFVDWILHRPESIGILFTPWGEALPHRAYQEAIVRLSHAPNVWKVAIQTNLSTRLDWLRESILDKVGLWATWHPTEVSMARFLAQCERLIALGVQFSVGTVGIREHFDAIEGLRAALAPEIYLWINAFKDVPHYYNQAEIQRLASIDPHFRTNLEDHASLGFLCRTGSSVFTVDGFGDMRRCHFVKQVIGNIYRDDFIEALHERSCPNATCGCHIGYVHLDSLQLDQVYGQGILERNPINSHVGHGF